MKTIYISPSDLAFLYDESKWGFYSKYVSGVKRPPVILPKIFTIIDSLIKDSYIGQNLNKINKNLPDAILTSNDKWVVSKSIVNPEYPNISIQIRGKIDAVLDYQDGSYSVIDFKTSEINENFLNKYKRQLHSYAYAILNPENSSNFTLSNLKNIGLLVFEPTKFYIDYNDLAGLKGNFKWISFDLNIIDFENFIKNDLIPLLAGVEPKPEENDNCWQYLKQFGFEYQQE